MKTHQDFFRFNQTIKAKDVREMHETPRNMQNTALEQTCFEEFCALSLLGSLYRVIENSFAELGVIKAQRSTARKSN